MSGLLLTLCALVTSKVFKKSSVRHSESHEFDTWESCSALCSASLIQDAEARFARDSFIFSVEARPKALRFQLAA